MLLPFPRKDRPSFCLLDKVCNTSTDPSDCHLKAFTTLLDLRQFDKSISYDRDKRTDKMTEKILSSFSSSYRYCKPTLVKLQPRQPFLL